MADQPTLFDDGRTTGDLRAELKAAYAERARLNDLYMHHSTNNRRREEEIRAHADRAAWWRVTRATSHQIIARAKAPIDQLAAAVKAHQCEADREPLIAALRSVNELAGGHDPATDPGPLAEVRWLREYIRRAGAQLHDEHKQADVPPYDRCRCVGCELIVGTDLRGEQQDLTAAESRTALQQRVIDAENARDEALQHLRFEQSANEQLRKTLNHRPVESYQ